MGRRRAAVRHGARPAHRRGVRPALAVPGVGPAAGGGPRRPQRRRAGQPADLGAHRRGDADVPLARGPGGRHHRDRRAGRVAVAHRARRRGRPFRRRRPRAPRPGVGGDRAHHAGPGGARLGGAVDALRRGGRARRRPRRRRGLRRRRRGGAGGDLRGGARLLGAPRRDARRRRLRRRPGVGQRRGRRLRVAAGGDRLADRAQHGGGARRGRRPSDAAPLGLEHRNWDRRGPVAPAASSCAERSPPAGDHTRRTRTSGTRHTVSGW